MARIVRAQRLSELPEQRRYGAIIADLRRSELSDLGVAILGGACADMVLLEALERYRARHDSNAADDFPVRIPPTFGGRISLGARIHLYGRWVQEDLDGVREIRNAFAHSVETFDFAHPAISSAANVLHFAQSRFRFAGRAQPASPRARFVDTVEMITDLLLSDSLRRVRGVRGEQSLQAGGPATKAH